LTRKWTSDERYHLDSDEHAGDVSAAILAPVSLLITRPAKPPPNSQGPPFKAYWASRIAVKAKAPAAKAAKP
jgi:hypothetical protein